MMAARAVPVWGLFISFGAALDRAQAQTRVEVKLEVTQSIQYFETPGYPDNGIPLVAGRRAGVRAKVTVSGAPAGAKVDRVNGKLVVTSAAGAAGAPIAPLNAAPFAAFLKQNVAGMAAFDRAKEDHTLNFEVPNLAEGVLKFDVPISVTFTDGSATPGTGKAELEAFKVHAPKILCVPIYHGMVERAADPAKVKSAIALARSCLPFPEGEWIVVDSKERKMWRDRGCEGVLDLADPAGSLKSDVDYLLSELEERRLLYAENGVGSYDHVVGFVPHDDADTPGEGDDESILGDEGCMEVFGYSWPCGTAGLCTTLASVVRKTFPHELGHMLLDEPHCDEVGIFDCAVSSVGWDIDKAGGSYVRAHRTSFMTSGDLGSKKPWITPEIYARFLDTFRSGTYDCAAAGIVPAADAPRRAAKKVPRAIAVQGSFSQDGKKLLWLDPVFRYPWSLRPTPDSPGGRYEVKVVGVSGTERKVRFDARHQVEPKQGRGKARYGFFSVLVPFCENEDVERLDILDADSQGGPAKRYGGFERSSTPPVLEITGPAPGARIDRELAISWDIESKAERLLFQIVYSPDGGRAFLPLAVNLEAVKTFKIDDVQELIRMKSEKGALIRIYVSDGLNYDSKEVGGLILP